METLQAGWRGAGAEKDMREGQVDEAIFAAKLEDVAHGKGPVDYRDPVIFFNKTHLTAGLSNLLESVISRVNGKGKGEAVIQLQTPFGGGKTHALLALYHLFEHWDRVSRIDVVKQI